MDMFSQRYQARHTMALEARRGQLCEPERRACIFSEQTANNSKADNDFAGHSTMGFFLASVFHTSKHIY